MIQVPTTRPSPAMKRLSESLWHDRSWRSAHSSPCRYLPANSAAVVPAITAPVQARISYRRTCLSCAPIRSGAQRSPRIDRRCYTRPAAARRARLGARHGRPTALRAEDAGPPPPRPQLDHRGRPVASVAVTTKSAHCRSSSTGTAGGSAARRPCRGRSGLAGRHRADGGRTCTTPARGHSGRAAWSAGSVARGGRRASARSGLVRWQAPSRRARGAPQGGGTNLLASFPTIR